MLASPFRLSLHLVPIPFLLVLFTSAAALTQPFDTSAESPNSVGRFNALAADGPALANLRRSPELRDRIAPAFNVFRTLAAVLDARVETNNPRACNLRQVPWVGAALANIKVRQVGEYPDLCQSRFDSNEAAREGEIDSDFADGLRTVVKNARMAGFNAMKSISALPDSSEPARNWTNDRWPLRGWDLEEGSQQCSLDFMFGYRINDVWYLQMDVSNYPVNSYRPDWERQMVVEFVREDFDANLRLPHSKIDDDEIINATTFLQRWRGEVAFSSVMRMSFEENPALSEAARLNRQDVELARDSLTRSNVAILALPMLMNIIPVAYVADLGGFGMLMYIAFTDVFSAVPFLIKGVELLKFAETTRTETAAYTMGDSTLGQMEVWAADCRGEESFRVYGIVFICIGSLSVVVGLTLEIVADMTMRKRRAVQGHDAAGPFGMAMFNSTLYAPVGAGDEEEHNETLLSELRKQHPDWFEPTGPQDHSSMSTMSLELRKAGDVYRHNLAGGGDRPDNSAAERGLIAQWLIFTRLFRRMLRMRSLPIDHAARDEEAGRPDVRPFLPRSEDNIGGDEAGHIPSESESSLCRANAASVSTAGVH